MADRTLFCLCVDIQELDFQTEVYHPMIDYDTGELDTKKEFPRWRYIHSSQGEREGGR